MTTRDENDENSTSEDEGDRDNVTQRVEDHEEEDGATDGLVGYEATRGNCGDDTAGRRSKRHPQGA